MPFLRYCPETKKLEFKYLTSGSLRSPNYTAHPQGQFNPHAKFFEILSGILSVTMTDDATKLDDEAIPSMPRSINAEDTKMDVV